MKWKHFPCSGPLWVESTDHRWIPLTNASVADLWCFFWRAPEQKVEPTPNLPVIWDAIPFMWRHCNDFMKSCFTSRDRACFCYHKLKVSYIFRLAALMNILFEGMLEAGISALHHDMWGCFFHTLVYFWQIYFITVKSQWALWRLKSPASRLFDQLFLQAHIKENIKGPLHWPLWGKFDQSPVVSPHKGPVIRKCFHLVTSSCQNELFCTFDILGNRFSWFRIYIQMYSFIYVLLS